LSRATWQIVPFHIFMGIQPGTYRFEKSASSIMIMERVHIYFGIGNGRENPDALDRFFRAPHPAASC
jgi:hypothetical protein